MLILHHAWHVNISQMSRSLGGVEPSGIGTARLSLSFAVDVDEWTYYCLKPRVEEGSRGSPIWGRPLRRSPSAPLYVCVSTQTCTNICMLGINLIMQSLRPPPPFALSTVPLMNNDLIVGCSAKCQLSVCVWRAIWQECFFSPLPSSSSLRLLLFLKKVFVCLQCSGSSQQERLKSSFIIPISHAAPQTSSTFGPIILDSVVMMDWIQILQTCRHAVCAFVCRGHCNLLAQLSMRPVSPLPW